MKKYLISIIIILLMVLGLSLGLGLDLGTSNPKSNPTPIKLKMPEVTFKYKFEEQVSSINELYIYGKSLNLKGTIDVSGIDTLELILLGKKEISIPLNFNKTNYYISSKKNNGLLLDKLDIDNYVVFLKATIQNNVKYFKLQNKTDYKNTEYYTIRKDDKFNHIVIKEDKEDTLNIRVNSSKEKEIYDVAIDAGHGGIDSGACYNGNCETDFTLKLSQKLKEKLEKEGLKVKLTRDSDLDKNTRFETYGKNGRIDRAFTSKAKYLFSFHLNSGLLKNSGIEIYTTNNTDYTLARSIADSIVKNTNANYSSHPVFKVGNGIYTRTFQKYEINNANQNAKKEGYEPYKITTDTTYYFIIRETGGIVTGAYTDGREEEINPHYNSNVGIESYIIELGYITNTKDVNDIKNNMDKYIDSIAKAIISNICG